MLCTNGGILYIPDQRCRYFPNYGIEIFVKIIVSSIRYYREFEVKNGKDSGSIPVSKGVGIGEKSNTHRYVRKFERDYKYCS